MGRLGWPFVAQRGLAAGARETVSCFISSQYSRSLRPEASLCGVDGDSAIAVYCRPLPPTSATKIKRRGIASLASFWTTERTPRDVPPKMIPVAALVQVALRLGLAKPIVRAFLARAGSESLQRKAFAGFEPTHHDVFVTTFAKSGTNWMMQIAQQIAHRGEAEFGHIHDLVAWPDAPFRASIPLDDLRVVNRSPVGLRVIKTHLATQYVPYRDDATYLTVLRDPKEVVVSSYHFLLGIAGATRHVTPNEWYELVARPDALLGKWAEHTASFWEWRDRTNALVLTYSEAKDNPRDCVERVAKTMGVALEPAEFEKVVERSSFRWMKEHQSQFGPPRMPFVKERAAMIRRGEAGASDEMLSRAQQIAIDEMSRAELERLGSSFPYETAFAQAK